MRGTFYFIVLFLFIVGSSGAQNQREVVRATLNGLQFVFDSESGSILSMSYPATGVMLQTSHDSAGIIDLAFPVREFEPLRLASRYSKNAEIKHTKGIVTIHWPELGPSRSFTKYRGNVSATVILKEESDGQSISVSCKIENQSDHAVPQIIFPDFSGLLPFCGKDGTEFRTGGTAIKPFVDLVPAEKDNFYPVNGSMRRYQFGNFMGRNNLMIKWMDIGGRIGGLSIFAKTWGKNNGNNEEVFLKLSETTGKLRYMNTLNIDIAPNTSWESAEYILTPHQNGWAKGIIPYREYANQNIKKLYPMPDHIRDGLGFQTLWMRNFFYPDDPQGNNFKFTDLPKVAKESKEAGLEELVLWSWNESFKIPLAPPFKFLGTEQELINAVAECKKHGVNISLFISASLGDSATAKKYNLTPGMQNFTSHPEFLPVLSPRYAKAGSCSSVPSSNKLWQEEVFASTKHLIDVGAASFCWEQFYTVGPGQHLDTLISGIRKLAKEKDRQSTLAGEAGTNMEKECNYLDYTWNWDYNDGSDYRALLSSLNGLRINLNIDKSLADVKRGFADNLYLNVYPRKPDGVNGSDYISNHQELSKALKQCARLRKQFLNYFVNGTFIGDCLLSNDCAEAHVSAYTLPKSMLVIVVNKGPKKEINFQGNIQPWLKSSRGRYKVKEYDDGTLIKTTVINASQWNVKTLTMKNLGISIYEITAE